MAFLMIENIIVVNLLKLGFNMGVKCLSNLPFCLTDQERKYLERNPDPASYTCLPVACEDSWSESWCQEKKQKAELN